MELIITLLIIYALWQVCRMLKGKADISQKKAKMFGKKKRSNRNK